jgi:pimeloyl-ACP methyl ester carboxylesterase
MGANPSRRWVANGSIRLAVTDHGYIESEPIVALHGFPESALTWEPVARRLVEAGRRIVAPDLRGFGASDALRAVRAYRMERLLDDVEAVVRDLGAGPVDLLAHDWGGALAWLMAERRPHLVRRAVILNVPHPGVLRRAIFRDAGQRKRSSYVLKMQIPIIAERRLSRDRGAYLASLFPEEFYSSETIEQYRESWSRPGGVRSMLNWYRAAAWDRSLRPPTAPIDVPVAIVWGTKDPLFAPGLLDQSAALCADVEVFREPCGHAPHREVPDRVTEIVLSTFG